MIVTYVPSVSMGPVNVLLREEPFYEPLPGAGGSTRGADGQLETKILQPGEGDVRSMVDITKVTEQSQSLCYLAEDIMSDEDIPPAERRTKYRAGFEGEEITEKPLVEAAEKALAAAGKPEAYEQLQKDIREMLRSDLWECAALQTLLGPDGDKAGAKTEKDSDL
jgi:hypothetical protein